MNDFELTVPDLYHYVGGRGVLKVETNKGSPKDNRPL